MREVSKWILMIFLVIVSIEDARKRRIPALWLWSACLGVVIYRILVPNLNIWMIAGGIAAGIFFLVISRITEEGLGYGDSIGILILGIYLGFWNLMSVLSIAFLLLFCVTVPVLWRKKMSGKVRFPFFPFLTAGYMIYAAMEGSVV